MTNEIFPKSGIALLLVGLLSLSIASYLTIHREDGFDVNFVSYQTLQTLGDLPHISSIANPQSGLLRIKTEDEKLHEIPLDSGGQEHKVRGFNFVTSFDERSGNLVVNNFSLPLSPSSTYSLSDFVYSMADISSEHQAETKKLINDMGISPEDSSSVKIYKMANKLHKQLEPARGSPKSFMRQLSGFE